MRRGGHAHRKPTTSATPTHRAPSKEERALADADSLLAAEALSAACVENDPALRRQLKLRTPSPPPTPEPPLIEYPHDTRIYHFTDSPLPTPTRKWTLNAGATLGATVRDAVAELRLKGRGPARVAGGDDLMKGRLIVHVLNTCSGVEVRAGHGRGNCAEARRRNHSWSHRSTNNHSPLPTPTRSTNQPLPTAGVGRLAALVGRCGCGGD